MKQIYIIIILLFINIIHLFPKTDSTYWIDKGDYKEMNLKIGKVTFLKFSNDGTSLFTYGQDSILRKWDIENGIILNEYVINSNPRINFNLSADETKFGYTVGDNNTRFDVFNLKNEFIHSFYQSYRNYQNPCPYDYQIAHKGMAVYMFHPYLNQIICETDYEITCPTDDLYFEWYRGGSFDFFNPDSSGDYLFSSHPGSQKGSLAFSPDGNYTVYETGSHKHTYDMKADLSINYKYYTEVIGDRNFNVITVLNSSVTGGWPGFDFRRRYVFSNDSKLMTYISNFLNNL